MQEGGIFHGMEGFEAFDTMEEKQTPEGHVVQRACEVCGQDIQFLIPWAELFLVANGILPQAANPQVFSQWEIGQGKIYPKVYCGKDKSKVIFQYTPQKAGQLVNQAMSPTGVASAEQRQIIGQISQQLAGRRPG